MRNFRKGIVRCDEHRCHSYYLLMRAVGKWRLIVCELERPLDMGFTDIEIVAYILERYLLGDVSINIVLDHFGHAIARLIALIRGGEHLLKDFKHRDGKLIVVDWRITVEDVENVHHNAIHIALFDVKAIHKMIFRDQKVNEATLQHNKDFFVGILLIGVIDMIAKSVEKIEVTALDHVFTLGGFYVANALHHVFENVIVIWTFARNVVHNSIGRIWVGYTCLNDLKKVIVY